MPRAAQRMALGKGYQLRQRRGRDRGFSSGMRDCHADGRRGRGPPRRGGDTMSELAMDLAALSEQRSRTPELVAQRWASRSRRPLLPEDGKLLIIAADHPARGALDVRGDATAMASRSDLLHRLVVSLSRPGVDGVLAPPDMLEALLLIGELENKVVILSLIHISEPTRQAEISYAVF